MELRASLIRDDTCRWSGTRCAGSAAVILEVGDHPRRSRLSFNCKRGTSIDRCDRPMRLLQRAGEMPGEPFPAHREQQGSGAGTDEALLAGAGSTAAMRTSSALKWLRSVAGGQ